MKIILDPTIGVKLLSLYSLYKKIPAAYSTYKIFFNFSFDID